MDPIQAEFCQRNAETYYTAARNAVTPHQRIHWQEQAARWSARARRAMEHGAPMREVGAEYVAGIGWMYTITEDGVFQGRYGNFETEEAARRAAVNHDLRDWKL